MILPKPRQTQKHEKEIAIEMQEIEVELHRNAPNLTKK
jgi:hypothetical protein